MPVGNKTSTPIDWGVSDPPPPANQETTITMGAILALAGATCLVLEQGERGALTYVCYAAVLVGVVMIFYGLRSARNGQCEIQVGERYHLPPGGVSPCPLEWGVGSVITFYECNETKTGAPLKTSDAIAETHIHHTVSLLQQAKLNEGDPEVWLVEIAPTP